MKALSITGKLKDTMEVECNVPNNCWYFDIVPEGGWISKRELLVATFASAVLAFLVTLAFWQSQMRRYKDARYADEIERAAKKAQNAMKLKQDSCLI